MYTMMDDIVTTLENIPSVTTGISGDWATNHVFYGDAVTPLGVGGMNRGRCPFVRTYRGSRNFVQLDDTVSGRVESEIIVDFVVSPPSIKSQEAAWDKAYSIYNSFITTLRTLNNYRVTDTSVEQLVVNPTIFVLRCVISVENSY